MQAPSRRRQPLQSISAHPACTRAPPSLRTHPRTHACLPFPAQKATLETALSGGAPRVSLIRQQQQLQQEQAGMGAPGGAPRYGAPAPAPYGGGGAGGGSFGGRDFNDGNYRGGGAGDASGAPGGGSRGFKNYQVIICTCLNWFGGLVGFGAAR